MEKYITEKSKTHALLDKETGEIKDLNITRKVTLDEFIMVFFASYPELLTLPGLQLKVLMCCWKYSTYNANNAEEGNLLHNNAYFKQYCREDGLDASDANIDNCISGLSKRGLLIKRCKGEYLLNPNYFFKGKLTDRSKISYNLLVNK